MFKPAKYNFDEIRKGDTFGCPAVEPLRMDPYRFQLGIDITGFTITMKWKLCKDSCSSAIELSTEEGTIVITDSMNGMFEIPPFDANIPKGNYYVEMRVLKAGFGKGTILEGFIPVV